MRGVRAIGIRGGRLVGWAGSDVMGVGEGRGGEGGVVEGVDIRLFMAQQKPCGCLFLLSFSSFLFFTLRT